MIWFAASLFVVIGVLLIVRRREVARGQSMFLWGGTTMPGCVVAQGVILMLIGLLFIVAWRMGLLGDL